MKKSILLAALPLYAVADVYRYTFMRKRPPLLRKLLDKKSHAGDYYVRRDSAAERLRNMPCTRYTVRSDRGERLCGFYYPCSDSPSGRIAFIVHGYRSEHLETAGMFFELYHRRGFDVFTCDNTASGESGGRIFGYDVFESADCLKWLDFLTNEFGADVQILLHGFSLGGATVLKMSDRCPDNVRFIVSDSGYVDAREILRPSLGAAYPMFAAINRVIAGYSLKDSCVCDNVAHSKVPLLIVHGTADPTVPFSMAPRIFKLCPPGSECLFTEGLRHIETVHYNADDYEARLDSFIEKYFI